MEVVFVACYEASSQAIWLRNFIFRLQLIDLVERSLQFYCDNRAAELFCKNDKNSKRLRRIDIKYLVVNDRVQNHIMSVDIISIALNIVNLLTKGLPSIVFMDNVARMEMASPNDFLV